MSVTVPAVSCQDAHLLYRLCRLHNLVSTTSHCKNIKIYIQHAQTICTSADVPDSKRLCSVSQHASHVQAHRPY